MPINTAFQVGAFQQTAFQIIRTFIRKVVGRTEYIGIIPAGTIRVITIKPVKNRRAE